jgi:predicted KAP-like P-loop ATPase
MNNDFHADKPVSIESEDRFQRYNFACRIAKTIVQKKSTEGIIIGIYGAWGEGKTTVINFIDSELSKNEEVVCIKFNPWRYSDENTLLLNFFDKISKSLNVKLLNQKERTGRWLSKKSDFISCDIPKIGDISKVVNTIGNWLGSVDLEELKNRLDKIIIESQKKLVIFIDDIDRLDKNEIYSVLRLVKLTADFTNTTYILSFDEIAVSKSIGEKFGSGDLDSGRNFLEKIIQVPLVLPKAQPDALRDYCFEIINGIFKINNLDLPDGEGRRFALLFTTHLLNKFDTPRLIVRYTNSLSFSIPLLAGEANLVDLMIIEAIKITYPNFYSCIKENAEYFIGSHKDILGKSDEDKKNTVKTEIDRLCSGLKEKEKSSIIKLLQEIFPQLECVYKNMASYPEWKIEGWYKNKRIASQKYFNRYFSYSVIKGEISDVSFNQFINSLPIASEVDVIDNIERLIENSSADNFIYKLRRSEVDFNWEVSKKIASLLVIITELFPDNPQNYFLPSQTSRGQMAIFIFQLIKKHNNSKEQLYFSKEIIDKAVPLEFAFDILRWLNPNDEKSENIFTKEQIKEVWDVLLKRVLTEVGENDIFEKFPEEAYFICKFWEGLAKDEFNQYVHKILDKNPQKSISLLRTYLPRFRAMGDDKYRDGDFDEKTYKYFITILDKKYIAETIFKIYPETELRKQEVKWRTRDEVGLSDFEMVRQYYHWYSHDLEELK